MSRRLSLGRRSLNLSKEAALFSVTVGGFDLRFETAATLFSPGVLDGGTRALLSLIDLRPDDKVLDLGCGYGAMGVYAARTIDPSRVWLIDVDPFAVDHARRNLELNGVAGATALTSDGFRGLAETGFTKILCNPPFHADFATPKHMIEKGFNRLAVGGTFWIVTRRDRWYRNKLRSIFGGVRAHAKDGYFVFEATKTSPNYAGRKLERRATKRQKARP